MLRPLFRWSWLLLPHQVVRGWVWTLFLGKMLRSVWAPGVHHGHVVSRFFWKVNSSQRRPKLAWENSKHFATLPLVSREMTTAVETPYWWPVTYQIKEVLLIGPCSVGNLLQPISCHFAGKPVLVSKCGRESLSGIFFLIQTLNAAEKFHLPNQNLLVVLHKFVGTWHWVFCLCLVTVPSEPWQFQADVFCLTRSSQLLGYWYLSALFWGLWLIVSELLCEVYRQE